MNNLNQFKERVKKALASGETFTCRRVVRTHFKNHPFAEKYPDGIRECVEIYPCQKFGRVQSNSFTLITERGEIWCDWGKAGDWDFSENSATRKKENVCGNEYTETLSLTYTFE